MTNNLHGSFVMEEFIKIAKDQGFISSKLKKDDENVVGNPKTDTPVKDHRRYEPTEEYDVTKDDDIINKAHPDKKVQMAESQGEGGVVENIQEQQEKDIEAATNMPSGTLVGVHAEVINNLVKLANYYDSIGNSKTADKIDAVIKKIHHPFDNSRLHKEAFWPALLVGILGTVAPLAFDHFMNKGKPEVETYQKDEVKTKTTYDSSGKPIVEKTTTPKTLTRNVPKGRALKGIGAAGAAITILTMLGRSITSLQEDLKTDSKDLVDALNGFGDTAPSALRAAQMLTKFNNEIQSSNLSDDKAFNKLVIDAKKIKSDLPKLEQLILRATEVEDASYTPYGEAERVAAKFDDFKTSLEKFEKTFAQMERVGDKLDSDISSQTSAEGQEAAPVAQDISGVQELLAKRGFAGKTWNVPVSGEMDEATIKALTEIQNEIQQNQKVQQFAKSKGLTGSFSILKGDQLVADSNHLEEMFKFVEDRFI